MNQNDLVMSLTIETCYRPAPSLKWHMEDETKMDKEILDLEDLTSTEKLLLYMSQFMPSGNYETESLQEKLQKKTLTHQEFNELCENILNFLEYGCWREMEDVSILENVIVMTAKQAEPLMPLTMYEYDAINKMDMWQEMWGGEDIGELDTAVTAIFGNPEARQMIGQYALKGEYLELAENIGVADELGIEIEEA